MGTLAQELMHAFHRLDRFLGHEFNNREHSLNSNQRRYHAFFF